MGLPERFGVVVFELFEELDPFYRSPFERHGRIVAGRPGEARSAQRQPGPQGQLTRTWTVVVSRPGPQLA